MIKSVWVVSNNGSIFQAPFDFEDRYGYVHFKRGADGKRLAPVPRDRTHKTLRGAIDQRLATTKELHSSLSQALTFLESLDTDTKRRKAFKEGKLST